MSPKDKRREYASGAVYQRSSDGRWIGTLEAGWTAEGTRRRVTVSAKTQTECKRRLRDKRLQLETEGAPTAGASTRATVKQWADTWLDICKDTVRPETYTSHRSAVRKWIIPTLGHKRLDLLTPADLRTLDKAQLDHGKSENTVRRTAAVFKTMLRAAEQDGHRVPARVINKKGHQRPDTDRDALTRDQAIAVLDIASTLSDGSRWVAALLQGMRQGECLGLTWAAVDFDGKAIDVSWQLQALPYIDRADKSRGFRTPRNYEARHLEGAWHLVRPKTERGRRRIPLVPWMDAALQQWRDVCPPSPHDLVWPRSRGDQAGRPSSDREDTVEWHALQCAAEVGHPAGRWFHLHEARNTTATLLLEAGVDPEVIKAILGHSSIVTSRSYMRVNEQMTRAAMERVAERLQLSSGQ